MTEQQRRVLLWAFLAITVAWGAAWAGYRLVLRSRVTEEKIEAYLRSTDLARLKAEQRAAALRSLADQLNALTIEERRRVRLQEEWARWLDEMSDAEKETLLEATFPTGIKKMMAAFEQLSEEQRRHAIDDAIQRLKSTGELSFSQENRPAGDGPARPSRPPVSPQLEAKVRELGLKTFFAESSAQLKVEAAPLLEEIQRQMQTGGWNRRGR
jgi:hypothetical protein